MDTYLEKYHIPAVDYSEGVKTAYPQGVQAKEFILPKELLEQGLRLYKGYHNGARMLAEDIEEILMKD